MKIIIESNADFTPKGKRSVKVVTLRSAMGTVRRIRWYVGGRIYNQLAITAESMKLTQDWFSA